MELALAIAMGIVIAMIFCIVCFTLIVFWRNVLFILGAIAIPFAMVCFSEFY